MNNLFGTQDKQLSRADKTRLSRKNTNILQRWVIDYLNDSGQFRVWRSSNAPGTRLSNESKQVTGTLPDGTEVTIEAIIPVVYHKKNQTEFAILDICGFRLSDSKHTEIEIKTGNDRLSKEQSEHLTALQASGAIAFAVSDKHTFLEQIKPYMQNKQGF